MDEKMKELAESFQCKYTLFEKGASPELVGQAYREALKAGQAGGFYPAVFLMDEYAVEWLGEIVKDEYNRDEIIAGCKGKGKEILQERFDQYMEDLMEDLGPEAGQKWLEDFIGTETKGDELHDFIGYRSFCDGMLEADALLLEIPVKNPWEIIGYLPMGGWNECPAPEEMIDICKYWHEKYGVIPAVFTHDVMEFYAPLGLNGMDSLEAAKEQYAFCPDRIDQGTRTCKISELAAGLEKSDVWYFWWD